MIVIEFGRLLFSPGLPSLGCILTIIIIIITIRGVYNAEVYVFLVWLLLSFGHRGRVAVMCFNVQCNCGGQRTPVSVYKKKKKIDTDSLHNTKKKLTFRNVRVKCMSYDSNYIEVWGGS